MKHKERRNNVLEWIMNIGIIAMRHYNIDCVI